MRLILILVTGLTLSATTPAQAARAGWQIDRALAIADIVWHQPCDGKIPLQWQSMPREIAATVAVDLKTGRADCAITLNADRPTSWVEFCDTILHETGHIAGYRHPVGVLHPTGYRDHFHSPNPASVMSHDTPQSVAVARGARGKPVTHYWGFDRRCRDRGRAFLGIRSRFPLRERFH